MCNSTNKVSSAILTTKISFLKNYVGRSWAKWQRFEVKGKNRQKSLATDNACSPFFSCSGTPKEPKKYGVVGVPQKNFFYPHFRVFW